jgi:hypothetical protein
MFSVMSRRQKPATCLLPSRDIIGLLGASLSCRCWRQLRQLDLRMQMPMNAAQFTQRAFGFSAAGEGLGTLPTRRK